MLEVIAIAIGLLLAPACLAAGRPNVLFIVADDLNDWVGHLGRNAQARTPNIDRIAAAGLAFTSAYDSAPACNPSRASVMSGLRPFENGIYENEQDWTAAFGVDQALARRFLDAGYDVFGAGKIYHGSIYREGEWTEHFVPREVTLRRDPSAHDDGVGGVRFYPVANSTAEMTDFATVSWALEKLRAPHPKPFFLAVGLEKPHMPWAVPRKYFDMFPLDRIQLPPHIDGDLDDVPAIAKPAKGLNDHAQLIKAGRWKDAIQGYLAAIAFADEQIGRLVDGLNASPYRDNTIVVLWGDNGFHLGEKQIWRKFSLWEEGTRVPLVWVAPGVTSPGSVSNRPVDLTSIYPTLCELAGIAIPPNVHVPSLVPLLRSPARDWTNAALMTWRPGSSAVRIGPWRYIRYRDGSEELYDHDRDPFEWRNLAADAAYAGKKAELAQYLPRSYAKPLPLTKDRFPDRSAIAIALVALVAIVAAWGLRRRTAARNRR